MPETVIEAFRFAFMGHGTVYLWQIVVSFFVSIAVVLIGLVMFNKTQCTCVDVL